VGQADPQMAKEQEPTAHLVAVPVPTALVGQDNLLAAVAVEAHPVQAAPEVLVFILAELAVRL